MKYLKIKKLIFSALIILLVSQSIWLIGLYRLSVSNLHQTIDKCLVQAADAELRIRLVSLGENYEIRHTPYTDTATFHNQTIKTQDTIFDVRINKNDPTARSTVEQYILNGFLPVNVDKLDVLFRRCMKEHSLNVTDSYIEHIDLKKNRVVNHDAPKEKPSGYMESKIIALDIINTVGIKAYVDIPLLAVLEPFAFRLTVLSILNLLEACCLIWLLRNMIRKYRENLRLGKLIEKMSHNIKKPLMISTVKINDLSEPVAFKNWEDDLNATEEVINELNRINFYIDEVLAIIQQEEHPAIFAKENVKLYPFFTELKTQYEQITAKKVSVRVVANPKTTLYVNKIHFMNIMELLMNNAVMFSNDPVNIELQAYSEGQHATVIVKDDGWGIPENDLERVFHKFYKVQSHRERLSTKGYGMGLTYAKTVVCAMGGDILLNSEENDYTEVVMVFSNNPLFDEESKYFEKLGRSRMYRDIKDLHNYFSFVFDLYNWELTEVKIEPQEDPDDPYDPSVVKIAAKPKDPFVKSTVPYFIFEYYYDVRFIRTEGNLHIFAILKEKDPYHAERVNAKYAKFLLQNNI